jgi:hypothetical protein
MKNAVTIFEFKRHAFDGLSKKSLGHSASQGIDLADEHYTSTLSCTGAAAPRICFTLS